MNSRLKNLFSKVICLSVICGAQFLNGASLTAADNSIGNPKIIEITQSTMAIQDQERFGGFLQSIQTPSSFKLSKSCVRDERYCADTESRVVCRNVYRQICHTESRYRCHNEPGQCHTVPGRCRRFQACERSVCHWVEECEPSSTSCGPSHNVCGYEPYEACESVPEQVCEREYYCARYEHRDIIVPASFNVEIESGAKIKNREEQRLLFIDCRSKYEDDAVLGTLATDIIISRSNLFWINDKYIVKKK